MSMMRTLTVGMLLLQAALVTSFTSLKRPHHRQPSRTAGAITRVRGTVLRNSWLDSLEEAGKALSGALVQVFDGGRGNRSFRTYYNVIGVPEDASLTEIKVRFRKLMKENHPDATPLSSDLTTEKREARFAEILEAYKVLSDESLRQEYDSKLNNPFVAAFDLTYNLVRLSVDVVSEIVVPMTTEVVIPVTKEVIIMTSKDLNEFNLNEFKAAAKDAMMEGFRKGIRSGIHDTNAARDAAENAPRVAAAVASAVADSIIGSVKADWAVPGDEFTADSGGEADSVVPNNDDINSANPRRNAFRDVEAQAARRRLEKRNAATVTAAPAATVPSSSSASSSEAAAVAWKSWGISTTGWGIEK